ncbi:MFS transporter [Gordonia sp. PKS22-38]|uniref:MFS transporter n=1 Tax=Gordonia prachuapensis TaxID=3115651 RepID=A0ABU7MMZ7_9ACTN|nr:MFS transporter [Gordonia sp. PKS22-38]
MSSDPYVPVTDRSIITTLWPVLCAAIVGLVPFTVYSTYLVPIADSVSADTAAVGTLRGLGGVAALVTAIVFAPLLIRWRPTTAAATSLVLLALAAVVGTIPALAALATFCLGIGVATAMLLPALLTTATSTYTDTRDGGRAATMVTSCQTLAAVMAAPVIGVLAVWTGWRGVLWVTAGLAILIALYLVIRFRSAEGAPASAIGYWAAFRRIRARPDLLALIGIAALRTASFMGYLAFLAARYDSRFDMSAGTFTLVWTLSGASFFVGNFYAGRWLRRIDTAGRTPAMTVVASLAAVVAAVLVVFTTDVLMVALGATVAMGVGHAVIAAQVTTLIAHRGGEVTATAYSLNAAGMSFGVFAGATIGGVGLSVGGSLGLGIALAVPVVVAGALVPVAMMDGTGPQRL